MKHRNIIGSQVRKLRYQRGWSQERLTAKLQLQGLDISRASLGRIENGQQAVSGGVTQIQQGGYQDAISAGLSAGANLYAQRLMDRLDKEPFFVRVPGGTTFYLYVTQSVDLQKATLSASTQPSSRP